MAHSDQPLKEVNIHISAPHIYGSALEALELHQNSSLSFLNVGSGTGYVSCIVATILGPKSNNFSVEVYSDALQHSIQSFSNWKNDCNTDESRIPHIEWIHGNALNIDPLRGESVVGFDRIYVGASVTKDDSSRLTSLLRPGGILVGPVDDELVKVVRIGARKRSDLSTSSAYNSAIRRRQQKQHQDPDIAMDIEEDYDDNINTATNKSAIDNSDSIEEFTQHVLSGVRFAPLLNPKTEKILIPSRVWNPSIHHNYPDSFRKSCKEILLCSNMNSTQSLDQPSQFVVPQQQQESLHAKVNSAGMLPSVLWMEILSYTHRDWFEPSETETDFLKRRLKEEQANAQKAHQARLEAEARYHIAEQERDMYRVLARRCQLRFENLMHQRRPSTVVREGTGGFAAAAAAEDESIYAESIEDGIGAAGALLTGREQAVIFGLGAMLRSIQYGAGDEDSDTEIDHYNNTNNNRADIGGEYDGSQNQQRYNSNFQDMEEDEGEEFENEEFDNNNGAINMGSMQGTDLHVVGTSTSSNSNTGDIVEADGALSIPTAAAASISSSISLRHQPQTVSLGE